jgi:hypothetical protein
MRALAAVPMSDLAALAASADALGLPSLTGAYAHALMFPDLEMTCGPRGELVRERHGLRTGDGPLIVDGSAYYWVVLDANRGLLARTVSAAFAGHTVALGWPPRGLVTVRASEDAERLYWPPTLPELPDPFASSSAR